MSVKFNLSYVAVEALEITVRAIVAYEARGTDGMEYIQIENGIWDWVVFHCPELG